MDYILLLFQMVFHVSIFLEFLICFLSRRSTDRRFGLIVPKKWHLAYDNYLENGVKYFVALILLDVFILKDLSGFCFGYVDGLFV